MGKLINVSKIAKASFQGIMRITIFGVIVLILGMTVTVKADNNQSTPVPPSGISAKAYVLMEAGTGRVLASSNMDTAMPVASTTKVMSALLTLEQLELDTQFIVDSNAIKVEGTSMGLREGDMVTLRALATGMLLPSGNDAANAAAVRIAGSVPEFVSLMNERAADIGMTNTNFVTPSGLHDNEHYSTAYDMALLAREALQNTNFAAICSSKGVRLKYGNPPYSRTLSNHNRLLQSYEGCIGVKTGFTKKAGRCLVSAANRDGVTLICVTLSSNNDWQEHSRLLDYGFQTVEKVELPIICDDIRVNVVGGALPTVGVEPLGSAYACVENETVTQEVLLEPFYYAPIQEGDIVGKVRHIVNGNIVATTDLVANQGVNYAPKKQNASLWEKIKSFFVGLF